MGHIIKEIKIPDAAYSYISDDREEGNVLKNLSKINIFVGENNSGKSRFLRSILKKNDLEFIPNNEDFFDVNDKIEILKDNIEEFISGFEFNINTVIPELNPILREMKRVNFLITGEKYLQPILDLKELLRGFEEDTARIGSFKTVTSTYLTRTQTISKKWIGEKLLEILETVLNLDKPIEDVILDYNLTKLYIPILRGLRPINYGDAINWNDVDNIKELNKDVYWMRTIEDYFQDSSGGTEIFSGLNTYMNIKRFLLGTHKERKLIEEFENYLSEQFFENKRITLIPSLKEDGADYVLKIKIGDEEEKYIFDLGDGIQSIIIMTFPLFLKKDDNLLVFIEEPEHLLHPGLQRKLLETFYAHKGFENFQFFITTHSNHFLDILSDFNLISIYSLNKNLDETDNDEKLPTFSIQNLSQGDTNALEILGVRNSSVFLTNSTIWVEGTTDRHYLRHYLKIYQDYLKDNETVNYKKIEEDYHYSFVEYGGNNIVHWSFLDKEEKPINVERLCGRLFLISDQDQNKEKRHEQLTQTLGNRYHALKCREIENLVSPNVLLKIVKDYEGISEDETSDNINETFTYSQYKDRLLGKFIEDKIIINKDEMIRSSYKAESGTIKNKGSFLKKTINHIQNWDDLSQEAQEITENVYNFIRENNSL